MNTKNYKSTSTIDNLIHGYQQFKKEHFEKFNSFDTLVEHGQKPKALIVACCDSRVDPAIVTGCKPGELFVVRNVANLVPPYNTDPRHHGTSAALEFGVKGLGVTDIILFGHSHCGGIRNLMESPTDDNNFDFISAWMNIAEPAKKKVLEKYPNCSMDEKSQHCEKKSLLISLDNLATFPWIKQRIDSQQLFVHAWYFNLESGIIEAYNKETERFVALTD